MLEYVVPFVGLLCEVEIVLEARTSAGDDGYLKALAFFLLPSHELLDLRDRRLCQVDRCALCRMALARLDGILADVFVDILHHLLDLFRLHAVAHASLLEGLPG